MIILQIRMKSSISLEMSTCDLYSFKLPPDVILFICLIYSCSNACINYTLYMYSTVQYMYIPFVSCFLDIKIIDMLCQLFAHVSDQHKNFGH